MPEALWDKLFQYGAAGVLAAVMTWLFVRSGTEHRKDMTSLIDQWQDAHNALSLLVKENTRAFTEMLSTLNEIRRTFDKWDGVERRADRRPRRAADG